MVYRTLFNWTSRIGRLFIWTSKDLGVEIFGLHCCIKNFETTVDVICFL